MAAEFSALQRASRSTISFDYSKLVKRLPEPSGVSIDATTTSPGELEDSVKEAIGSDKQLNDYINFLASIRARLPRPVAEGESLEGDASEDGDSVSVDQFMSLSAELSSTTSAISMAYSGGGGSAIMATAHSEFHAAIEGEFIAADGTSFSFEGSVDVSVDISIAVVQSSAQQSDPLALDLNGDGSIALTDIESGLAFDINADGILDQSAFVGGGDGFLAWDRNRNGAIDDGSELFGDQHGAHNGYLELSQFDDDGNGAIDHRDKIFSELLVAAVGVNGALETRAVAEAAVQSVALSYREVDEQAMNGNAIKQRSVYQTSNGEERGTADVLLRYAAIG